MQLSIEGLLERIGIRKSLGVAMGGGGARGFQHVGVLMALEQFGRRPDIISGVSAGSICAALYGSGLTPQEIIECFTVNGKMADFTEWAVPKAGFMKLSKFEKLLDSWLPVKKLEDMKIPTVICATDFDAGKSVGWAKGEIVPRVLASCSIPILFHPVVINGVHYVDGGVLRNLPAWAIREHCDKLIGSNCSPLNRNYKYKDQLMEIALRTYALMSKANVLQDLNLCDLVIQPVEVSEYKIFDITSVKKIVTCGYDAACRVLEQSSK